MKIYMLAAIICGTSGHAFAQTVDSIADTSVTKIINLNEVVFSASRTEQPKSKVPYTVEVISSKQIALQNPQTSADMLTNTGAVMVQKSQAGGGSPVIRGFEASRVLLVVDGVRMNNAIYRAGHLQDIITIDNAMLDRAEVLFGPSSVMYGSDALGGVVHFYTKKPLFADQDGKMNFKLNSYLRYGSANQEKTGHVDFNMGFKKLASVTSVTYSDFDDLRIGNGRVPNQDFGLNNYYVGSNWNGTADSTIRNNDPNIQKKTGYSQVDLMEKLAYKASENVTIGLNLQYSTSSEINRYDRLTEAGSGGNLKFAQWYYGPQNRLLASLYADIRSEGKLFDNLRLTAAYQDIAQERVSRRFSTDYSNPTSNNNKLTDQKEKVNVYSLNADFRKKVKEKHDLGYGLDFAYNTVNSTATTTHITTGQEFSPAATRYPNGGSNTMSIGAYLSHSFKINEVVTMSEGLRFTHYSLNAIFDTAKTASPFQFPFTDVNQSNQALNGNLAFLISPEKNVTFSVIGSTGFRAPNVEDIAKVFESAGSNIVVPNPDLKPEYAYNLEGGLSTTVMDNKLRFEGNYFYTLLQNAVVLKESTYNGADSILFNGSLSRVTSYQNTDQAIIQGAYGAITIDFNEHVSFKTSLTYTHGMYREYRPTNEDHNHDTLIPLDHIPPMFGQSSLFYRFKKFESEISLRYSAAKESKDYSLGKEDNELYSADPVNGYMPAWTILNIKTAYHFTKNFTMNLGIENLFDQHYRVFASGVSSAGRNIMVAARIRF
jgi:hemoglobin/transferrin/lactoferrin receptor protein